MHYQSRNYGAERNHEIASMPLARPLEHPSWVAPAVAFMAGVLVVAGVLNYV